jgi:transcriptional regulator with XRE-family HTH domain
MTFAQKISEARKALKLSQKELATQIKKEDGESISPQYLNDLERNRRNPPSQFLIDQFARVLKIKPEVLYYLAGELPSDLKDLPAEDEKVVQAYKAFRQTLTGRRE